MFRILHTIVLVFLVSLFCSCEKDVEPTNEEIVDIIKQLPKQILYSEPNDVLSEVWSIQYDSLNRKINIFIDDTTNSNPYDQLKYSYEYNTAGYLVKYTHNEDSFWEESTTIDRDANNRIRYISDHDVFSSDPDTSFYSYDITGNSIKTTVTRKSEAFGTFSDVYTYAGEVLQSMHPLGVGISYNYTYSQKKMTAAIYKGGSEEYSLKFSYDSGHPDRKADYFLQLVLGKDHYIQDIRDLYFFFLFRDRRYVTVSASDPHHPTKLTTQYKASNGEKWTENRTYSYEFNDQHLPVRIIASYESQATVQYLIRY